MSEVLVESRVRVESVFFQVTDKQASVSVVTDTGLHKQGPISVVGNRVFKW